MLVCCVELG